MNFEDSKKNTENNKNDPFSQSFGYGQNSYEQQNYDNQSYRQDLTEQANFDEQYSYEQISYNQTKSNDQYVYGQQAEFQQHQQSAYDQQGNSQQYTEAVYGQGTYGQQNNTQQYAGTYGQRTYGQQGNSQQYTEAVYGQGTYGQQNNTQQYAGTYGQRTYGQQNSLEQSNTNQNSKYYNGANGYNSAPQRTYPDGDRLTRFKDYYDLFASNQTKRWLNVLVVICYLSSLGMFILGFFSAVNFLDCAVYAILTTLLLATKKWGFSLALTIYNGVAMLINIIFIIMSISMGLSDFSSSTIRGLIRGLLMLILAIGVTINLIRLNKGFKEHQATFRGY